MKEEILYKKLKSYLTKEYMKLSGEKDAILGEKVQLEVEKEKEEKPLFSNANVDRIKRMFSPLSDEVYDSVCSLNEKNNELSRKITELEKNSSKLDVDMEEMKEYIAFVQNMEMRWLEDVGETRDGKDTFDEDFIDENGVEEDNHPFDSESYMDINEEEYIDEEESNDATEMVFATAEFLEEQYPGIRFAVDFASDDYNVNSVMNANMVRVLTYTLSSTIESVEIDSVEIEMKRDGEKMILSVKMYYNDEEVSHYTHKYNIS